MAGLDPAIHAFLTFLSLVKFRCGGLQMRLWKIGCEEDRYPGVWRKWFREQCVAVGWGGPDGFHLDGKTKRSGGWNRARGALKKIRAGDLVVVALKGNRVGRIGEVVRTAIDDNQWNPFILPNERPPNGDKGRRILVRWDMLAGPPDEELVVSLPSGSRLTSGELRPALSEITSRTYEELKRAMNNPANWVPLWSRFHIESALSGYIAANPHLLQEGLRQHPDILVREHKFADGTRPDVILRDGDGNTVIVECKQHHPTYADLEQIRRYVRSFKKEKKQDARAILVHGGARNLSREIRTAMRRKPRVDIIQYRLNVDFSPCS